MVPLPQTQLQKRKGTVPGFSFTHVCDTHVHTFSHADSVITLHFNPINGIRLECCSIVNLASDHISCCAVLIMNVYVSLKA